jgi:N-carbamoylputrescine amidase
MATNEPRTLRVAALQLRSEPGGAVDNRTRAEAYVAQAAQQGASLLALPELFAPGYVANERIWELAEPPSGPTERWLGQLAARHGVYLGAGYAQTDGVDVFNLFALATPAGTIAGIVRKTNAEASVFQRRNGDHVIETDVGRIGVGICADNEFTSFLREMQEQRVDLVLMPHAWPTPTRIGGPVSTYDLQQAKEHMEALPLVYARALGVPVVFVNQVGPIARIAGLIGRLMDPAQFRCQGQARIVDSDGDVVGSLGDEEGIIVADVTLDPARRQEGMPRSYGGWVLPGSALPRKVIIPLDATVGTLRYRLRSARRRAICRVSADPSPCNRPPPHSDGSERALSGGDRSGSTFGK